MSAHNPQSSFGSSLFYEDRLPIKVECYNSEPPAGELLRVGQLNDEVLRSIMSLDEAVAAEKGDDKERQSELQRLEVKVNLMLDMLSELYAQSIEFPDLAPVKIGASQAYWLAGDSEAQSMELGANIGLHVYLTRRYPRPLVLMGQVKQRIQSELGEAWIELQLLPMPQQTQNSLERFVFRQHRRLVAFSRRK